MFTPGLEQLVHTIRGARHSGRIAFPPGLPEGAARRSDDEPAHLWMRRCIEEVGGVEKLAVEENLALLLVIHLRDGQLEYANLQALWAEVSIADFAAGEGTAPHRYLRADHDTRALGPLLKEPLPHVHAEAEGEPRFPVYLTAGRDVVGWFLDFVYRNFFYDHWVVWAEVAWDDWCVETNRSNRWQRLMQAFNQSNIGVLEGDPDLRDDLLQLKRCLLKHRRELFPVEVDTARLQLFGHDETI